MNRKEIAEIFAKKTLEKYGDLIKAIVMMGSVAREEFKPKSDIDIFVIIDDTKNEISGEELEKIDQELEKIAESIPEAWKKINGEKILLISLQPIYTLTEFWDYARVAHPIIYNFIKEGIPLYDSGFFMPLKRLLEKGKIPATREAIENYMENVPKKLGRLKTVKLLMIAEDCYYAMLNSAQAVLMFLGLSPPVPSKAYYEVKKHLVDNNLLEQEYADWLKEIIEIRKKIEHREIKEVSGKFVDEWEKRAEKFFERMFNLLNVLEIKKKEMVLKKTYEVMHKAAREALKELKVDFKNNLKEVFRKEFIEKKRIDSAYWNVWKRVEELFEKVEKGKVKEIEEKEVYQLREYVKRMIRDLAKSIEK